MQPNMNTNKKPVCILKFDFIFTHCWFDVKKRLTSHKIFSQKGANVFLIHKVGKPKKQQWLIRNPGCLFLSFDVHQPHLILFLFVRYLTKSGSIGSKWFPFGLTTFNLRTPFSSKPKK